MVDICHFTEMTFLTGYKLIAWMIKYNSSRDGNHNLHNRLFPKMEIIKTISPNSHLQFLKE
jgi:hypothetical protein